MTTDTLASKPQRSTPSAPVRRDAGVFARVGNIAWRNLWRNRRRTWLTAGGIAFAIWMLVFARSTQEGSFDLMIDNGARLFTGHAQYQHPEYMDNPRIEFTLSDAAALRERLQRQSGVEQVAIRAQSFALVSAGERSFGGQVLGVLPAHEASWSTVARSVSAGRYLQQPGEVFMGSVLARNLGLVVGDDVVMLGTGVEGGVAAAAGVLVGTFTSGQVELARSFVQIHIDDFRAGWELEADAAHAVVVVVEDIDDSRAIARVVPATTELRGYAWQELMPDTEQFVDLKMVGTELFFALIAVIVTFSIVNTFMMTVFERTPEIGMLKAVGMRPGTIMLQLQMEALWLCGVGMALGIGISAVMILLLAEVGIPLPADATEMFQQQYNLPDRLYPAFSVDAAVQACVIMLLATQIAAIIPALRIRRMAAVEALRGQE